nr:chorismate mutase 2 [Crinum x powellii]
MASSPYPWLFFLYSYNFIIFLPSFCKCGVLLSADLTPLTKGIFTLDSLRDSLTRQEDSIVFSLIERAKYPYNAPTYSHSYLGNCKNRSIVELFVRETEAVQAKVGRYQNPEELPFFPHGLPHPLLPPCNHSQLLYPASASVNVSKTIWDVYFNDLLPLFTTKGDDGNYGLTSASDLLCLQLLSRRIHYGRLVAEVKFRDAPNDYVSAIRAQDKDTLTKLVTSKNVEEMVQRRVMKKAMVFGQDVTSESKDNVTDTGGNQTKYKVDPSVVFRLYKEWVIPLTKVVEVEYLLHRLD